jgi:hypothetical protein
LCLRNDINLETSKYIWQKMTGFKEDQKERFIKHLTNCHSWHKHLSLLNGGQFIILLDERAGINYSSEHPKLPFGNTFEGYQVAFGQLTYFWKNYDEILFRADGESEVYSEAEITLKFKHIYRIQLFPYLSDDFSEVINFHKNDFNKIIRGEDHEESVGLKKIFTLNEKLNEYWQDILTEKERDSIVAEDFSTENSKRYNSIENEIYKQLKLLKQKEINKISNAIEKIKEDRQ